MPLYLVHVNIFGLPTNVFEILAILAIGFWIAKNRKGFLNKSLRLPKLLIVSIVILLAGIILSLLFNNYSAAGLGILKSWFLIPIAFSYMLYVNLDSKPTIEKVFLSIYFSAVLVGLISIIYKILGIVTYDNRLESFYLSPNYLAMYLSSGIFFGCYFLIKNLKNNFCNYQFLAQIILLIIILVPLYYTYSYGSWLAVCAATLILIMILAKSRRLVTMSILGIFFVVIFIFQINTPKFLALTHSPERSSFTSRMMIWDTSLMIIKQHPFLGIGPGNFQTVYLSLQKYFSPYLEWAVPEPHNIFLAFWIQAGILGLIGFLFLLFFVFRVILEILKNKTERLLLMPLLGFFLYTILHGLIDTTYWKNDLSFLFWVCIFTTIAIKNIIETKNQNR